MKAKQSGFTLVEMIVTIGIAALILGLGIPSFIEFARNNRMTGAANDLLADLNLARTEAVKRRVPVTVCATADALVSTPTCAAPNSTSFTAWVVFVDDANPTVDSAADGNATIDSGEVILRRHATLPSGMTSKSDRGFASYARSGFPLAVGSPSVTSVTRVVICDSRGNVGRVAGQSAARAVTVSATGRAAVTRSTSEITALGGC
jgi:type IV fimbrial biogenesis protein FimT